MGRLTTNMLIFEKWWESGKIDSTSMVRRKTHHMHTSYQSGEGRKGKQMAEKSFFDLCLLYQSFFNFAFPSRLCDAGSSLRLWCLASTLKPPWITDGYLVALQCCTSSAHISPLFVVVFVPHRCLVGSQASISLDVGHSLALLSFALCFRALDFCQNSGK